MSHAAQHHPGRHGPRPSEDHAPADADGSHLPLAYRRRAIYAVMLAAGVLAGLYLSWQIRWVFTLVFASMLLAVFLRGGADLLARLLAPAVRLRPGVSLGLFCLLLVAAAGVFVALAVPGLSEQVDQLRGQLPQAVEGLRERLRHTGWGTYLLEQFDGGQPAATAGSPESVAKRAAGWAGSAISFVVAVLFFLFMGLYMAAEPGMYVRGVLWLVPPRGRKRADAALKRIGHTLRYWLLGQLAAMTAVGLLTGVGLWVLGAPLPVVGGTLAALLEFVPNVGPAVAAALPTLLSLGAEGRYVSGPPLAGAVLVWFLIVQSVESYLLTPLIQRRAVELPPALLIFTQLAAALLFGAIGVAIAAPLVAAAMAASRELLVVGDPDREHPKDRAHEGNV